MEKKVAVVTGASRGIGRAIAIDLASKGVAVTVNYLNNDKAASEVVAEINEASEAIAVKADVADETQVVKIMEATLNAFGRVDILVNNAGSIEQPGNWEDIGKKQWQRTFDVNVGGVFNCIRAFAPYFLEKKSGKIVNIASTYGIMGAAPVVAYTAAKASILNMTLSFAKELAPYVNVNSVAPGNIDTDMTKGAGPELIKTIIESTPLKRLGTPQDIAHMVSFLSSKKADFITGQLFVVDGGHMLS